MYAYMLVGAAIGFALFLPEAPGDAWIGAIFGALAGLGLHPKYSPVGGNAVLHDLMQWVLRGR